MRMPPDPFFQPSSIHESSFEKLERVCRERLPDPETWDGHPRYRVPIAVSVTTIPTFTNTEPMLEVGQEFIEFELFKRFDKQAEWRRVLI